MSIKPVPEHPFLSTVSAELKRAERYRTFVSFVVIDLEPIAGRYQYDYDALMQHVMSVARRSVREVDDVAALGSTKLAFLFPETTRQGAEIAINRLNEIIRGRLSQVIDQPVEDMIPLEMASYPDTSGAKTIHVILQELAEQHKN